MKYQKAKTIVNQFAVANDKRLALQEREKTESEDVRVLEVGPSRLKAGLADLEELRASLLSQIATCETRIDEHKKALQHTPEALTLARSALSKTQDEVKKAEQVCARLGQNVEEAARVVREVQAKEEARKAAELAKDQKILAMPEEERANYLKLKAWDKRKARALEKGNVTHKAEGPDGEIFKVACTGKGCTYCNAKKVSQPV